VVEIKTFLSRSLSAISSISEVFPPHPTTAITLPLQEKRGRTLSIRSPSTSSGSAFEAAEVAELVEAVEASILLFSLFIFLSSFVKW
jgi:hypothetical protein